MFVRTYSSSASWHKFSAKSTMLLFPQSDKNVIKFVVSPAAGVTGALRVDFMLRKFSSFHCNFFKYVTVITSECQTVWIQIRPDKMSGLFWVQIVWEGYRLTDKKLNLPTTPPQSDIAALASLWDSTTPWKWHSDVKPSSMASSFLVWLLFPWWRW